MNRVPQNRHLKFKNIILLILTIQILACVGQVKEKVINHDVSITTQGENLIGNISTTFPQIHANLNGMVKEFVRTMHQDKKGQYWFGTNGNGIIRYDGKILEAVVIEGVKPNMRILEIIEDKNNNIWFATSEGLIKYDGNKFTPLPHTSEDQKKEIWGLAMDKNEIIWIGALDGVYRYNGESFIPFELPQLKVKKWRPMLSSTLIFKIIEDQNGTMWFATDGNGIFTFKNDTFEHLTSNNVLTDDHVADILEDRDGNVWIGSFYGGVSKYDGSMYTHYSKNGTIKGEETYNFLEDTQGNIWFTSEGFGVYRYDGFSFRQFTTDDGLTSNVTQCIFQDHDGQIWFGSWQGLSIYDGHTIKDAKEKEPWTE